MKRVFWIVSELCFGALVVTLYAFVLTRGRILL